MVCVNSRVFSSLLEAAWVVAVSFDPGRKTLHELAQELGHILVGQLAFTVE